MVMSGSDEHGEQPKFTDVRHTINLNPGCTILLYFDRENISG